MPAADDLIVLTKTQIEAARAEDQAAAQVAIQALQSAAAADATTKATAARDAAIAAIAASAVTGNYVTDPDTGIAYFVIGAS